MLAWVVIYRRQHRQAQGDPPFRSGPIHSFPSFLTSLHHYLLTSSFPYALPSSVCCNSFVCRSYENYRGVYQQFPFWNESTRSNVEESLITRHHIQVLSFQILAHSFELRCTFLHSRKTQLVSFQALPHSLQKNTHSGREPFGKRTGLLREMRSERAYYFTVQLGARP